MHAIHQPILLSILEFEGEDKLEVDRVSEDLVRCKYKFKVRLQSRRGSCNYN